LTVPHDTLFWRFGEQMAIRRGDWKLVRWGSNEAVDAGETWPKLYDLVSDVGESRDVAARKPERVAELEAAWCAWDATLPRPTGRSGEQRVNREIR
jgi:arylsulfatase A-like enzyme